MAALAVVTPLFLIIGSSGSSDVSSTAPRAVIIDQLSLTMPNDDFRLSATNLLEHAGYRVDYYPGQQVTVPLYQGLPSHRYSLILLRAHSAMSVEVDKSTGQATSVEYVSLFTGEPYDQNKYSKEHGVGWAAYFDGGPRVFSIGARFVETSMKGKFGKTLVVLMGCEGLKTRTTAQAFIDRGASAVVGWTGPVLPGHTDAATLSLLQHVLNGGLTLEQALAQTVSEVGPDPSSGAQFLLLPVH